MRRKTRQANSLGRLGSGRGVARQRIGRNLARRLPMLMGLCIAVSQSQCKLSF